LIICGVELSASVANIAVIDFSEEVSLVSDAPRKIKLNDDETVEGIRAFSDAFLSVIQDHGIEAVSIKARAKKGEYAGGPVSFKMEAAIQLVAPVSVVIVHGAGISAAEKKSALVVPEEGFAYQKNAKLAAAFALFKGLV